LKPSFVGLKRRILERGGKQGAAREKKRGTIAENLTVFHEGEGLEFVLGGGDVMVGIRGRGRSHRKKREEERREKGKQETGISNIWGKRPDRWIAI